MRFLRIAVVCFFFAAIIQAQPIWQSNLDGKIEFYQTTELGTLLAGTDNSLYAIDAQTGGTIWRRKHKGLDETSITPVPETDLVLLSLDRGDKSVLQALDLMSGETIWQSEKVKGDVMQLAVGPDGDLLALVLVKKARGKAGETIKREPVIHVLQLSSGNELWKKQLDSGIEMMPARFAESGEVSFTLDNYRPPLMLDGRLYLFYEGFTSYDARTGGEKQSEKFKVNEGGLALTEADPLYDDRFIYASGRGRIRAIDRRSGETSWQANDLGVTPEMALVNGALLVRTGGQFTSLRDGEPEEKGPFGISAIDPRNGKTQWRWKGADKGLTNFTLRNTTVFVADRNELISLDSKTGKRTAKIEHKIERAQFVILNEMGEAVVGGRNEIAAFKLNGGTFTESWRAKHKAPGRGVFRIIGAVALRATALYFRYGGFASSVFNMGRSALNFRSALRWSGIKTRFSSVDLTSLASNYAQNMVSNRIRVFGTLSRVQNLSGFEIRRPNIAGRLMPTRAEVQESLWDRLDPASQAEKLSNYLLRKKRLAELRGNFMYFYTELPKPFDRKGLIGVNVHSGALGRYVLASDPDMRFVTDEVSGLLYSADGNKLQAFEFLNQ